MCQPTKERKRVVISGAGPAGLLLASILLSKNKESSSTVTYDVTLLDGREDYGVFTKEELTKNHRSWMLALADHGLDAIRTLPGLYENFVEGEGISVKEIGIHYGSRKLVVGTGASDVFSKEGERPSEAFVVDRNFVVAAIARYIRKTHENDPNYHALYETKLQYVDYENKRVLIRDVETKEEHYIDYDLLAGCDGVRSTAREALVRAHSDFAFDYNDIFMEFKQVHLKAPAEGVTLKGLSILPEVFPDFQGICLPETGGMINVGVGIPRNHFDSMPDELKSADHKVVAEYVRKNFKAFVLEDYDDFGKQWVGQRWNQTGMVHCNFYHSLKTGIVLLGDAAHATSPSIGMGMNTALRDAQILSEILAETNNDFAKALPLYSEARVKEGNALSDLAFHLSSLNSREQIMEVVHMVVRTFLFTKLPWLINEHPQSMIGRRGVALSDVYEQAVKLGIMRKHRATNDMVRLEYFEKKTGMVKGSYNGRSMVTSLLWGAAIVAVGAYVYQKAQENAWI